MPANDARTLRWVEGFRDLRPADVDRLSRQCRWRWYRPRQPVVAAADESRDVHFIVQGRVRVTIYSAAGKEVTFRDLGVGEIFGELSAIDGKPRSASVVALSDALVASAPAEAYWDMLRAHPALAAACLKRLAHLVRTLSERVFELSTLPVSSRVRLELLRLAHQHMRDDDTAVIRPAPAQAELASRLSTHREAVSREFGLLARAGFLRREGHALIVQRVRELDELVAGTDGGKGG